MNKTSGFSCSAGELNSLAVLAYNLYFHTRASYPYEEKPYENLIANLFGYENKKSGPWENKQDTQLSYFKIILL